MDGGKFNDMIMFFIFFYFIFSVFNLILLKKKLINNGWGVFSYSYIYLIIFYNFIPFLLYFLNYVGLNIGSSYIIPKLNENYEIHLFLCLCILLGFIFINFSYNRTSFLLKYNYKIVVSKYIGFKLLLLTLISAISLYFYIKGFGSLTNAIIQSDLIRSGLYKEINSDKDTGFTIFKRFIFLAIIPFVYFFYAKNTKQVKNYSVYFAICSVIVFINYVFLSASRQSIVDLVLLFIFSYLIKYNKIINLKLVSVAILVLFLLPILDVFFIKNSYGESQLNQSNSNLLYVFINEFSFPFLSLYYSIQEYYRFFYFSDFFVGLSGSFLPSSWFSNFKTSNYLNSFFTQGLVEKGYVPPGLFGQGYYSLGILGVILVSFFTGFIFKVIDNHFKVLISLDRNLVIFYSYIILFSLTWIRTGLPSNFFYNLTFLCMYLFILYSFKLKKHEN